MVLLRKITNKAALVRDYCCTAVLFPLMQGNFGPIKSEPKRFDHYRAVLLLHSIVFFRIIDIAALQKMVLINNSYFFTVALLLTAFSFIPGIQGGFFSNSNPSPADNLVSNANKSHTQQYVMYMQIDSLSINNSTIFTYGICMM